MADCVCIVYCGCLFSFFTAQVCQHPFLFGEPKDKMTGEFVGVKSSEVSCARRCPCNMYTHKRSQKREGERRKAVRTEISPCRLLCSLCVFRRREQLYVMSRSQSQLLFFWQVHRFRKNTLRLLCLVFFFLLSAACFVLFFFFFFEIHPRRIKCVDRPIALFVSSRSLC